MLNEPVDHAVTRGCDVSLRYEGGHSTEYHTVVLENFEAVNYPKVVLEEATPEERRTETEQAKSQWRKEEKKQQGYEDRARKTSKIWSNDEKNREEQSQQQADKSRANGRQEKNKANSRQSEQKDCDRDKANFEVKHITEESCSQPVPKHPRTDADVQQGQYELKFDEVVTIIPKIDFNMETVEYKNPSFTVQKDTEVIHGEVEGGTKINCYMEENQSKFSEKNVDWAQARVAQAIFGSNVFCSAFNLKRLFSFAFQIMAKSTVKDTGLAEFDQSEQSTTDRALPLWRRLLAPIVPLKA